MKNVVFFIIIGGLLLSFNQQVSSEMSQKYSSETTEERRLLSHDVSDGQIAHLFSANIIETRIKGGKQGRMVYRQLYVDIEQIATGHRRRVWQHKFLLMSPQAVPRSFTFGKTETEGQLCLGMASDFRVYYASIHLKSPTEEEQAPTPMTLGSFHIHNFMVHDVLRFLRIDKPGILIQQVSLSSTGEWEIGVQIRILNDTMLPLAFQGTPKGQDVQWRLKKIF